MYNQTFTHTHDSENRVNFKCWHMCYQYVTPGAHLYTWSLQDNFAFVLLANMCFVLNADVSSNSIWNMLFDLIIYLQIYWNFSNWFHSWYSLFIISLIVYQISITFICKITKKKIKMVNSFSTYLKNL